MSDSSRRVRILIRFVVGLTIAVVLAEGTARVAEAAGPPALRWYDAATQLKVEQMNALDAADVVFAGTSMVWQGFDPAVFAAADGRTSYNAGLAGGVPVVMEPWLLDQVIPRTDPELVVWGFSSMDFSTSYGAENLERYLDALETRRGMLAAVERATASASALVGYRTILRDPSALFGMEHDRIEQDFADARAILGSGGVRRDYTADVGMARAETVAARVTNFALDPADLAAVARTVGALRARGIEVVFAEMPVPDRFVALHPNRFDDLERVHLATVALGAALDVDVIDLRSGYTDADFVDFTHLDADGAAQLTETLAARLRGDAPNAGVVGADTGIDRDEVIEIAAHAAAVNDSAYRLIAAVTPGAGSELWYGAPHYGHTRDLTVAAASGEGRAVVFLGSSLMVNAGLPSVFTELDGRTAYNVAIPGTEPTMIDAWIRDVVPLADPDVIVWGISPQFFRPGGLDAQACGAITEAWVTAADLRQRVFESVPAADGIDPMELLFGDPPTADPSYASAIHSNYRRNFSDDGGRTRWPTRSDRAKTEARDALAAAMESYFICEPRVEQFVATVGWLTQTGIDVVLVAMPTSDLEASAYPGGRDQILDILESVSRVGLEAGAVAYLDLSDIMTDGRFRDLRHVDGRGAEKFTTRVANELAKRGV